MNVEMTRIYKDLIDEVLSKLEMEGEPEGIGRNLIYELHKGWTQNIRAWYEKDNEEDSYNNEQLNEDLSKESIDIYNSSDEDFEMMPDTKNFLMCMYVKVQRTKNKYKCNFKQGFVNLGNIDFAFANAQGELEW